jgi:hypothetical protein
MAAMSADLEPVRTGPALVVWTSWSSIRRIFAARHVMADAHGDAQVMRGLSIASASTRLEEVYNDEPTES